MWNFNLDNELLWVTHLEELFIRTAKNKQENVQGELWNSKTFNCTIRITGRINPFL